jgi:hypothetical protein
LRLLENHPTAAKPVCESVAKSVDYRLWITGLLAVDYSLARLSANTYTVSVTITQIERTSTLMKTVFFTLSLPFLLSAGCNAYPTPQPVRELHTQAIQNTNPKQEQPESASQAWKIMTNSKLAFSLSYPSSWKVGTWGPAHPDPADDEPSITNPQHPAQPVYVELSVYNCPSAEVRKCLEDYLANYQTTDKRWGFDATDIKVLTTSTGLIGAFYDILDKAMPSQIAMFAYPDDLKPNTQIAVHLRSYEGPISDDQSSIFLKIAKSFQFTR